MSAKALRHFMKRSFFTGLNLLPLNNKRDICPIFCYHSIDDSGSLPAISPPCFYNQMKYLKDLGYKTITLSEYCRTLKNRRPPPPRSVVITFDDGFENNYTVAYPILKEMGFQATIFLAAGYMGKICNWQRTIDIPRLPMMSWDQISQMSDGGIEFGSHGTSHSSLTNMPLEEAKAELVQSKMIIEKQLSRKVHTICYPYGDVNQDIIRFVQAEGYLGACSSRFGYDNGVEDLFWMKRMNINCTGRIDDDVRMLVFKACLNGSAVNFVKLRERLSWLKAQPLQIITERSK